MGMMSEANQAKVLRVLNEKWKDKKCLMCSSTSIGVEPEVYELREFNNGNVVVGGNQNLYPVVPVTCSECGHTTFINAKVIGAM